VTNADTTTAKLTTRLHNNVIVQWWWLLFIVATYLYLFLCSVIASMHRVLPWPSVLLPRFVYCRWFFCGATSKRSLVVAGRCLMPVTELSLTDMGNTRHQRTVNGLFTASVIVTVSTCETICMAQLRLTSRILMLCRPHKSYSVLYTLCNSCFGCYIKTPHCYLTYLDIKKLWK